MGANKAFENPEFKSSKLAKNFMDLLDRKDLIVDILGNNKDFNVYIGNEINGLDDFSIVTFKNKVAGKDLGTIGIIGPTRMDYSKVISVMKYISHELNKKAKWWKRGIKLEEKIDNIVENTNNENEKNIKQNNEINELKDKINLQKKDIEEKEDRIKRLMAEFENFKKRSDKERTNLYNSVMGDVVTSLLPVIDNLEKAASVETKDEQYKNGIRNGTKSI